MRILVTGASGFIGRHLVRSLGTQHEVFGLSRARRGAGEFCAGWIDMDLAEPLAPARLPSKIDAVVHLAQSSAYNAFPDGVGDVLGVNVRAAVELASYAVEAGAHGFVLASTGSVYRKAVEPLTEDLPANPPDFYGASKLAAELLCGAFESRLDVCALRLFFPYGPGQDRRLVHSLISRVTEGRAVTLEGERDGMSFNPTYVGDVVDVTRTALEQRWTGAINVAAPEVWNVRRAAEAIAARTGCEARFEHAGTGEPGSLVPDLSRLRDRIDVERFTSFETGLEQTLAARAGGGRC